MAGVLKTKRVAGEKPVCKFGRKCYQKNPQHIKSYSHPGRNDNDNNADDETAPGPVSLETSKTRQGKTVDEYFGKPRRSHDVSGSDSEENSTDQPPKKKKIDNSLSDTAKEVKKVSTDEDEKSKEDVEKNEGDDEDIDVSLPASPEDVKENIKNKFLVDMPEDFYQFWEFCQSLKPENPRSALEDALNLIMVGPFDVLSGRHKQIRKNKQGRQPNFLLHYRYFYDPPEFQTVLASNEKSQFHLGYYRDDPKENPAFVASNAPGEASAEKIYPHGENLFAAVYIYATKLLKSRSGNKKKSIEQLVQSIEQQAKTCGLPLAEVTKKMKDRKKTVVCPTFHGAGIVVPVDGNDVGYRPVPETPGDLRAMLKKISVAKTEKEQEESFEALQELITLVQFANDECDYGEGLELGLDLFSFGARVFHPQIASLLPLAYQLLNRDEFSKIITEHLKCRREVTDCVDELAV